MSHIEVRWDDNSQTIICCAFTPGWTLDDFYSAYSLTEEMIRTSPEHVIGIIVEDNNTSPPPNSLTAFQHIFKRGTLPMAVIGGHQLTKLLLKVVTKTTTSKRLVIQVSDLEEARLVLKQSTENSPD